MIRSRRIPAHRAAPSRHGSHLRAEPVYRPVIAAFLGVFRLLGLRFRITGRENLPAEGGAVLAITHLGYLEFAFTAAVPWWDHRRFVRFLATDASYRHAVSGPLMRKMRHIPVDRAAGSAAYAHAVRALRAGELVGVFPEAGVNRSWTLKVFKSGAVRMAAEAGVPLIPVVVWGGHRVLTKGRRPRWRDAHRAAISITFGTPVRFAPADLDTAAKTVAATSGLRDTMVALLDAAQRDYPDRPGADPWWLPAHLGGSAPAPSPLTEARPSLS